jgi:hypothetical protein
MAHESKRRLQMLSFGKFSTRLAQTTIWYPDAVIKRISEAYTTKQ